GENLVRFASLVTSGGYPAARMGAVFGAKRCKAVVVVGSVPGSDYLVDAYRALIPTNPLTLSQHTPPGFGTWPSAELEGYFSATGFDPREFMSHLTRSTGGCPGCPQDCMKSFDGTPLHQQAVAAFTGLGIHDLSTVLALNTRCVRWGVDPVSLAGVLAYRCSVPGGPSFGDVPALLALASDVVSRRSVLAEGVARASRVLGGEEHAMHCKGIELPVFDPRGNQGLALSFAVHPLGPRYDGVEHDIDFDPVWGQPQFVRNAGLPSPLPMDSLTDTKVDLVADLMELWSGYDAVGVCLFAAPPTRNLTEATAADLVSAVTGRTVTPSDIRSLGRQRLQLMLDYNL
ncbi:aldehyde ferredoxin oxidoreductase C-terminal domain-containing protein, partial [Kibdelosporangium lantanae]